MKLEKAGVIVTKGELSTIFRTEGHKHYKIERVSDKNAGNFLKGFSYKERGIASNSNRDPFHYRVIGSLYF